MVYVKQMYDWSSDFQAVIDHYQGKLDKYLTDRGFQVLSVNNSPFSDRSSEFVRLLALLNDSVLITPSPESFLSYPIENKRILVRRKTPWKKVAEQLGVILSGDVIEQPRLNPLKPLMPGQEYHVVVDECVNPALVPYLKAQGYKVYSVRKHKSGCPDPEVGEFTIDAGAVLVTADKGFFNNHDGLKLFFHPSDSRLRLVEQLGDLLGL